MNVTIVLISIFEIVFGFLLSYFNIYRYDKPQYLKLLKKLHINNNGMITRNVIPIINGFMIGNGIVNLIVFGFK